MAVSDDVKRLSQLDSIYLAETRYSALGGPITSWYKGRLQQANDGSWIFRSISSDGTVVGFQLGAVTAGGWASKETPAFGTIVTILITLTGVSGWVGNIQLTQQLPQEVTN
jgi:hypothetical protein